MKHKTAEELWNEECVNSNYGYKTSGIAAMKKHAIAFAYWLNAEGYQEYDESDVWIQPSSSRRLYTTEQLYNKFNESYTTA